MLTIINGTILYLYNNTPHCPPSNPSTISTKCQSLTKLRYWCKHIWTLTLAIVRLHLHVTSWTSSLEKAMMYDSFLPQPCSYSSGLSQAFSHGSQCSQRFSVTKNIRSFELSDHQNPNAKYHDSTASPCVKLRAKNHNRVCSKQKQWFVQNLLE